MLDEKDVKIVRPVNCAEDTVNIPDSAKLFILSIIERAYDDTLSIRCNMCETGPGVSCDDCRDSIKEEVYTEFGKDATGFGLNLLDMLPRVPNILL